MIYWLREQSFFSPVSFIVLRASYWRRSPREKICIHGNHWMSEQSIGESILNKLFSFNCYSLLLKMICRNTTSLATSLVVDHRREAFQSPQSINASVIQTHQWSPASLFRFCLVWLVGFANICSDDTEQWWGQLIQLNAYFGNEISLNEVQFSSSFVWKMSLSCLRVSKSAFINNT